MSDKPKELTPKLRFPEFAKDGQWSARPLDELCDRIVEKVGEVALTPVSITAGHGFVAQAEKFGRDISGAQYKNYIRLRRGEFAYNKGNSTLYPQGCVYQLKEYDEAAASNAFICFRFRKGNAPGFFEGLFEKNAHGRQLAKFLTSGARSDGLLNIKADEFFSISLPVPPRPAEQQKIAACLASMDGRLVVEERKLETLRSHQKALIQQLFPRKGETDPGLRFPEFRDAPAWEERLLGEVAVNLDSKRVPISEKDRTKGEIPYYGASGIVDYVDDYIFDENLLCISEDGANLVSRTYPIAFSISGKTWVNNHAHVLQFDDLARQTLVEVYLNATDLRDFITGMAQPKLNRGMLDTIPIPLPPSPTEEHRLAACLSSLDEVIAEQSRKLGCLKAHKKGFMQRLFPSPEGE